ncbi:VWA domain-containing protein [Luteolibacter yonseiensis]|uniref:VWA domain-containing protein n=1 Tax=Luteolibacter yonseiensis TaxID=1144680 RepID=A0A934R631_9BACT|nr:VWA domain-containing protein [Luteolibacter yonseiensis]MBK1817886.1 VWA domain-containing protein [Luteolibacter yonseiensis]
MSAFLEHFRFAQPAWLLLLVPAMLLLALRRGRGSEAAVVFPNLSVLVSLGRRVRNVAWGFGLPLAFLSLICAILAISRPVWRNEYQSRTASGIDIMIAFDVSLSMKIDDFVDHGEQQQRIVVAKKVVDDFISRRPEDRMGLVAFAGRPRDASPITLDHQWLRNSLNQLQLFEEGIGTVKEQGTAIGSALAAASVRLQDRDAKSKIIVLITDGASNSGKISPIEAAEHAKTLGIKIYTVAIGTTKGRVDRSVMLFPYQEFDLPTLQKIASLTGGEHYWAQNLSQLKETFTTIDNLEKTEAKSLTVIDDTELFPWFVAATLFAALASAFYVALNPPPSA